MSKRYMITAVVLLAFVGVGVRWRTRAAERVEVKITLGGNPLATTNYEWPLSQGEPLDMVEIKDMTAVRVFGPDGSDHGFEAAELFVLLDNKRGGEVGVISITPTGLGERAPQIARLREYAATLGITEQVEHTLAKWETMPQPTDAWPVLERTGTKLSNGVEVMFEMWLWAGPQEQACLTKMDLSTPGFADIPPGYGGSPIPERKSYYKD